MSKPFFVTALFFALLALLMAVDAALNALGLLPTFVGLRWLRVHFITLGVMAEALFGVLVAWAAARAGKTAERPGRTLLVWVLFNLGLAGLMVGIPSVNPPMILFGGTLIMVDVGILTWLVLRSRGGVAASPALGFHIAGLLFLFIGALLGTGMWLGWSAPLGVHNALEAHIHANNWGFMGLVFAGLLVEFYPAITGKDVAWPRLRPLLLAALSLGALLLVLGPWLGNNDLVMPGIALYLLSTLVFLASLVKPILGERAAWSPGMWHLLSAYVWILLPVVSAPLLLLGVLQVPLADVEASAPQALIYGWVFQVGYALIPWAIQRARHPEKSATLGGCWGGLVAVTLGGVCLWLSIFNPGLAGPLRGAAYGLWGLSMLPFLRDTARALDVC